MISSKSSRGPVSKTSAAAAPAVNAPSVRGSSILLSAFTPSISQLSLFASVIQAFDSQHLRIHDIHTGRLKCDHVLPTGVRIRSLDWRPRQLDTSRERGVGANNRKKRKVPNGVPSNSDEEEVVIAYGTSESEIQLFSVYDSKLVSTLSGGHDRGINDFRFTGDLPSEGWSIGGDGKLVQWDVVKRLVKRTISLPSTTMGALSPPMALFPRVLCASQRPIVVNLDAKKNDQITQFDAFRQPVHSLICSFTLDDRADELFLASDAGRPMNIYNVAQKRLVRTLIADSEITSLDFYDGVGKNDASDQILLATTVSGTVELFTQPFDGPPINDSKPNDIKSKRKNLTRKCDASIRLTWPDTEGSGAAAIRSSFQGPDVVIAWAQGAIDIIFERVQWRHEETGGLSFRGLKRIFPSKRASTLNSIHVNGVENPGKIYVDESQAIITDIPAQATLGSQQDEAISISSGDITGDAEDDIDPEAGELDTATIENHRVPEGFLERTKGVGGSDREMADVDEAAEHNAINNRVFASDEEDEEPTFRDMINAQEAAEPISITDALVDPGSGALVQSTKAKNSSLQSIPSGHSLSTILTQSLRTNDQSLLESCFHETDNSTIRLTIQRMDSSLAGVLLEKLAERLSRPGRYAQLLVWLQWVCVAHGGVIASRPDILQKIRILNGALTKRSHALSNLLLLKGKLDMLDAQVGLRRAMIAQRGGVTGRQANKESIIYVEGQDESSSSEDEEVTGATAGGREISRKSLQELAEENEAEIHEVDEDVPMINGITSASEDEDDEEDEEAVEEEEEEYEDDSDEKNSDNLVDDEAVLDLDEGSDAAEIVEDESEEDAEEDDEGADSEMADFINDEEISVAESGAELDPDDTPEKPPSKKHKKR